MTKKTLPSPPGNLQPIACPGKRVRTPINLSDITDTTPFRLKDAIAIAFPMGGMTEKGLRREAKRGRLKVSRIAGKDFTTLRDIAEMMESCRVNSSLPAYGSESATVVRRSGSSKTAASNSSLARLSTNVERLKRRSPNTSAGSTSQTLRTDIRRAS
jgi:hypothetical protein